MEKSLLSAKQKQFLRYFSNEAHLKNQFYLSGGTALSEYYLQHRYSEDLDFFSEIEFKPQDITLLLGSKKSKFGNPIIEFENSFNRNIYKLIYTKRNFLKVEFTYFPFKPIENHKKINNIKIDSLVDIAVNKIFTIYQSPRGRDYYDLYFILNKQTSLNIQKLVDFARIKFDTNINYLQLGTNLSKVVSCLDDPIIKKVVSRKQLEKFFLYQAKKIQEKFIK
jgi:predicted nucleotidyltransferase component of viral defense system